MARMTSKGKRRTVLVTGGAGYVDSHACKVLALGHLAGHPGASAFNLGNGGGFTVREVIAAAERVTGRKIPLREGPRRPGDPPALVANAGSARRKLGWKPRYQALEVMIATAWRWLQSGKGDARRKKHDSAARWRPRRGGVGLRSRRTIESTPR